MQGVKRAKAKVLKFRRPISILCLRPNDLVREHEQRIHIVAAFLIRIPGNLDFQNRATDPGRKILLYHSQNLFHSPGFFTHARLALIVRQSGSGNMHPSRSSNSRLRVPFIGSNDFTEWWHSAVARHGLKIWWLSFTLTR